jgi:hypothetical protein
MYSHNSPLAVICKMHCRVRVATQYLWCWTSQRLSKRITGENNMRMEWVREGGVHINPSPQRDALLRSQPATEGTRNSSIHIQMCAQSVRVHEKETATPGMSHFALFTWHAPRFRFLLCVFYLRTRAQNCRLGRCGPANFQSEKREVRPIIFTA